MCSNVCIEFGRAQLLSADVAEKKVLEVGAFNVNGSLREGVEALKPSCYLGVDIAHGPGVDEICEVSNLVRQYGKESFDVVICTELLEHVLDWRSAVSNLKNVLRANGVMIITTRSKGFQYHGYPFDFWRYEVADMDVIFSDCSVEVNIKDSLEPGVLVKVRKPADFIENLCGDHELYSIVTGKRCSNIDAIDLRIFRVKKIIRRQMSRVLSLRMETIKNKLFKRKTRSRA
ncbi:MAG: methyltransferase domain-containing protein [Deltaproteobacteria bacterium]